MLNTFVLIPFVLSPWQGIKRTCLEITRFRERVQIERETRATYHWIRLTRAYNVILTSFEQVLVHTYALEIALSSSPALLLRPVESRTHALSFEAVMYSSHEIITGAFVSLTASILCRSWSTERSRWTASAAHERANRM
jgi:hypothetical protein